VIDKAQLQELKIEAKALACRYYALTGKPLAITGEIAELEAAGLQVVRTQPTSPAKSVENGGVQPSLRDLTVQICPLGLELADVRTLGFDAHRARDGVTERIQIKGGAVDPSDCYRGRCLSIKCGDELESVMTVLLDRATLAVLETWEATEENVQRRLHAPGLKSRNERNSMGLSQFKSIAQKVWPVYA